MKQINELTSQPWQKNTIVLEDNQTFDLTLQYVENQYSWFFSISYNNTFVLNNARLVSAPNLLRQHKNILPFGLFISTDDATDPYFINDFINARVTVYILTQEEVDEVETLFYTT